MSSRYEIRLAGEGGQGLVLAGLILAEAASLHDGKNATMIQSYGAQIRGGPSQAEVVISDTEIDYPKVLKPNLLLAMTQDAFDKYHDGVERGGIIIADSGRIEKAVAEHAHAERLPLEKLSKQITGSERSANIIALGVITALTKVVSRKAIHAALRARAPKGTMEQNEIALRAGFEMAGKIKVKRPH